MSLEDAAHDLRTVRLLARSSTLSSASATIDIRLKIRLCKLQPRWNSIKNNSYRLSVRFPEDRHPELSTECIHNSPLYRKSKEILFLKIRTRNFRA